MYLQLCFSTGEPHLIKQRLAAVAAIVFLIIGIDQWSKAWAIGALKDTGTHQYLHGAILLMYAENTGAWGSMGASLNDSLRFWLLTVIPIIFLGGITWYTITSKELKPYMVASYALVVGGGVGNLIDRALHGYVVDFMWMGIPGGLGTNIFNVADVAIMAGVITLIVLHFVLERQQIIANA